MAYNGRYSGNPDALPAHVEPEQAAAMLSNRPGSYSNAPPQQAPAPAPAPAHSMRNDNHYSRPPPQTGYQSSGPPPQQNYYDGRQQPARHDNYPPAQNNQYGNPAPSQQQHRYSNAPPAPAPPARNPYASPPPPTQGPPPNQYHDRPPIPTAQRPPTVAPPPAGNDRDALWPLFRAVDQERTGQLSETSLRRALVNGDYTAFDPHTVRMMIRMFDTDRSGTISFDEFCGLWGFLAAWRGLFDRFDVDRSGNINYTEFSDALVAFGYRLSPQFVELLFNTYAKSVGGPNGREKCLSFDLFVQACISLKRMTDVFKRYDQDRDGYITLSFEEFLTGAQSLFLFNSISAVTDTGLY